MRVHSAWLKAAVFSGAVTTVPMAQYMIDPTRFEAVRWKFRGWSWVDPTKEVEAYREAVRCGFTTTSAVIAQTAGGLDIEDVLEERAEELKDMAALGLVFDTDPSIPAKSPVAKSDAPADAPTDATPPDGSAKPARVVDISRSKANA
jgi:capsid protein